MSCVFADADVESVVAVEVRKWLLRGGSTSSGCIGEGIISIDRLYIMSSGPSLVFARGFIQLVEPFLKL